MPLDLPPAPHAYVQPASARPDPVQTAPAPRRPAAQDPLNAPPLVGVVGVCVRWNAADPLHVAEVVVVTPSGNPTLDTAIVPTVKANSWPRPAGDTGGWTGRYVAIGEPAPAGPPPSCDRLPAHTGH